MVQRRWPIQSVAARQVSRASRRQNFRSSRLLMPVANPVNDALSGFSTCESALGEIRKRSIRAISVSGNWFVAGM